MGASAMRIAVVVSVMVSGVVSMVNMGRKRSTARGGRGSNDTPRALVHRRAAGWLVVTLDLIKRCWVLGTATPQREEAAGRRLACSARSI